MTGPNGLLGFFGGTFNPIHLGHLRAGEQVVEMLALERLLFVPAGDPPHKRGEDLAPAALRLSWVERAVAGNARFQADDLEIRRQGPSYTLDTIRCLARRTAPERPVFVIGTDALREMDTWHQPEAILAETHLAVMARPGCEEGPGSRLPGAFPGALGAPFRFEADGLSGQHRETGTFARWLAIDALPISATDLRDRLLEGRSIRYLVPESIHRPLLESGCYRRPRSAT